MTATCAACSGSSFARFLFFAVRRRIGISIGIVSWANIQRWLIAVFGCGFWRATTRRSTACTRCTFYRCSITIVVVRGRSSRRSCNIIAIGRIGAGIIGRIICRRRNIILIDRIVAAVVPILVLAALVTVRAVVTPIVTVIAIISLRTRAVIVATLFTTLVFPVNRGLQDTMIVFRMLVIVFSKDRIVSTILRQRNVFFVNLLGVSTNAPVRTVTVKSLKLRIYRTFIRLLPTARTLIVVVVVVVQDNYLQLLNFVDDMLLE
jgi:hypothetical protein